MLTATSAGDMRSYADVFPSAIRTRRRRLGQSKTSTSLEVAAGPLRAALEATTVNR